MCRSIKKAYIWPLYKITNSVRVNPDRRLQNTTAVNQDPISSTVNFHSQKQRICRAKNNNYVRRRKTTARRISTFILIHAAVIRVQFALEVRAASRAHHHNTSAAYDFRGKRGRASIRRTWRTRIYFLRVVHIMQPARSISGSRISRGCAIFLFYRETMWFLVCVDYHENSKAIQVRK